MKSIVGTNNFYQPLFCAAILVCCSTSFAAMINEIRIDQPGTDNDEYFELFGTPGESLNSLTYVVLGDGAGGSGVIEAVVSLAGQSIPPSGYFVVAENTFTLGVPDFVTSLNFENSDNVTHLLVDGFTGAVNTDLDANDDGALDVIPWASVVDGVALILEANPPTTTEFEYATVLGFDTVGPDGSFVPGHVYRRPDGGAWQVGGFTLGENDTPGAANIPEPGAILLSLCGLCSLFLARRSR